MQKKIAVFIFLVGVTFACNALDNTNTNPNLIKNGDFSNKLKNWFCGVSSKKVQVIPSGGGIRITRKENKSPLRIFQDAKVQPGGVYELSFRVKQNESSKCLFWIILKTKTKWLSKNIIYIGSKKNDGEWETVKKEITIPDDVTLARINFRINGENSTALIDDIIFKKILPSNEK